MCVRNNERMSAKERSCCGTPFPSPLLYVRFFQLTPASMGLDVVRRRLRVKSSTIKLTVIVTSPPGLTERGFTLAWTRFSALTVDCEEGGREGER